MVSTPPTRARVRSLWPIMPAASIAPMKLVEQASVVEKAGILGFIPALKISSRAMLEIVALGTTCPQTSRSGLACAYIADATAADRLIIDWLA
jgi:hypothetical protein